jgi:hypothetical protein
LEFGAKIYSKVEGLGLNRLRMRERGIVKEDQKGNTLFYKQYYVSKAKFAMKTFSLLFKLLTLPLLLPEKE